ncbi:oxygen-insensitive NADPH nitroreductase [Natribacillus halophilus]|nr:oxygen-insensitive NADPH nitroreductase [Natribacillus halophilus]
MSKKSVTETIQEHRSIRKFTSTPIEDDILQDLFTSAQWAPSSHNVQAYSIIVVKRPTSKQKLAECCGGQRWVKECPVFLVFCADFYRLEMTTEMHGTSFEIDEAENLVVGTVDTALAAQNVFLTAKSYGLGGVMIGGVRNHPGQVADLLNLPELTIPIMGMCLGYPDQHPWQKPRLPQETVVHYESYHTGRLKKHLQDYEQISADYYTRRTQGRKTIGWTKQMAEYLSEPRREELSYFIKNQGIQIK